MRKALLSLAVLLVAGVAMAQGYEPPQTVDVPGWVLTVIGFFASKWVLPFALAGVVMAAVQVLRVVVSAFGSQLGPKGVYLAGLLVSFLTAFGDAAADGSVAGQEWVAVLIALATFIAAALGYKLLFSDAAKMRIKNGK